MGCSFVACQKKPFTPGACYQPGVKVYLYSRLVRRTGSKGYSRWGDGTGSKGVWPIYTRAIFFLAFFADSSPLRPCHTEDAAATPPDAGRHHRLARVRGPHTTPRADDLAAAARPGPTRASRCLVSFGKLILSLAPTTSLLMRS